nr:uncharacterized protein LOC124497552 [Dermatophagoides farinae]
MDKLSDRVFKAKITKSFKSKKFDRKLVSELNEEFENRTAGLDEDELELWKKYDDILKAMINNVNLNELLNNDDGDDDVDLNESDADNDDRSTHGSHLDDDDRVSSSGSNPDAKNDIPIYKIVNSIKSFKDNVAEWPAFKSRVESLIIERKNISESSKRIIISGIVRGKASSIWDRCETQKMDIKKSWKALSKEF